MAILTIDLSGRGGLAPRFFGDINRSTSNPGIHYIGKANQMADGWWNPFRRYGYMSPANNGYKTITSAITALDGLVQGMVYDEVNDDWYAVTRGINMYHGDGLDDTSFGTIDHAIASAVFTDLNIYQVNGARKMFALYKKSGNMDILMTDLPASSFNDNFLTGTTSGAFTNATATSPFMRNADNGFSYIFQDAYVHKFDGTTGGGTNGTVTPNVLSFPAFFQLTDAVDSRGIMYIAMLQRTSDISVAEGASTFISSCGVYLWDRQSTQVQMRDYIPIQGAKEIRKIYVSPKGDVRIIVVMADRSVRIMTLNGSTPQIIAEAGIGAYPNIPASFKVANLGAFWIADDGNVYYHGQVTHLDDEGLFKIGNITTTNTTNAASTIKGGAILYGAANTFSGNAGIRLDLEGLIISYDISSSHFLQKFHFNGVASIDSVSQITLGLTNYTLVSFLPKLSTVHRLRIYMAAGSTSGASAVATCAIYLNQNATPWATKTITRDDQAKGYVDFPINKPYVNSIQLGLTPNSSQQLGDFDFAPAYAEVEYVATPNAPSAPQAVAK